MNSDDELIVDWIHGNIKSKYGELSNEQKLIICHYMIQTTLQMLWKTFPEVEQLWTTGAIAKGNCVLIGDLQEINKQLERLHK